MQAVAIAWVVAQSIWGLTVWGCMAYVVINRRRYSPLAAVIAGTALLAAADLAGVVAMLLLSLRAWATSPSTAQGVAAAIHSTCRAGGLLCLVLSARQGPIDEC